MTPKDTPHTATQGASESSEPLGRFGHHPDPAIDFCVEIEAIEAEIADLKAGFEPTMALQDRIDEAICFRVGGDARAVAAKNALRAALAQRQPADPKAPSQDTSRGQARAPSHASKLELEPNGHTEECNRGIGDQSQSGNCATRSDAVRASGAEPCSRSGDAAQHEVTEGRGLYGAPATSSQEALDARRYRWLRERDVWTTAYGGVKWCMELRQAPATLGQPFHSATYGTHLDAAIDAAIAKGPSHE